MKTFVLAAIVALTLGMSVASAAPQIGDGTNASPIGEQMNYAIPGG
jgi:hypothetical protein